MNTHINKYPMCSHYYMVACSNCKKREAQHQSAMNLNGRLVYMPLCDVCYKELVKRSEKTSLLDQFSRDLTKLAEENRLDPVIGRQKEIKRLIHILSRRTKNNPVLIGEPGVGKTAIVEGLAQRIFSGSVPEPLLKKRLVALDLAALIAGTVHRGAFEKRLKEVIDEVVEAKGQVILFIDEVHTIVGAGASQGSLDASNILKPYLARGDLQLIGATTLKEYRVIEKDAALERRFQQIIVDEPTMEQTELILEGLRPNYEDHHKVKISKGSIKAAVKLSKRYIADKYLPDKAIDLIDEAGAALRLKLSAEEPTNLREVIAQIDEIKVKISRKSNSDQVKKLKEQLDVLEGVKKELMELWTKTKLEKIPTLKPEHIASVASVATGIPVTDLTANERQKLKHLGREMKKVVVGQDESVNSVSEAIKRARVGVKQINKPIGTFMFLGPSGVGKTLLAKALAKTLYGSEDYLIRVDMSEFNEKHNISRLIGSPPGYVGFDEGGQLTDKVRRKPFSVVLFDEVEKAHQDVFHTLLQVMDEGRLTDGHGRVVDFKNTIIIMTSNIGSEFLNRNKIGFAEVDVDKLSKGLEGQINGDPEGKLMGSLKKSFRPEFLNRIDEILVFNSLNKQDVEKILEIETAHLSRLLKTERISLEMTEKAKQYLIENGYEREMGARPLKRLIQKEVESRVSEMMIDKSVKKGDVLQLKCKNDKLLLTVKQPVTVEV